MQVTRGQRQGQDGGRARHGGARSEPLSEGQAEAVRSFTRDRGGDVRTFVDDEKGTSWREVHTYIDDEVTVTYQAQNPRDDGARGHDRQGLRHRPTGHASRDEASNPDLIGPVITEYGTKFHRDLNCPTLNRSRKPRKEMCRQCGLSISIQEVPKVFLDAKSQVHTDAECPRIRVPAAGCDRCQQCSALRDQRLGSGDRDL